MTQSSSPNHGPNNAAKQPGSAPSRPLFSTPQSIVAGGLCVGILAMIILLVGLYLQEQVQEEPATQFLLAGIFGIGALALGVMCAAMLIIGSIRWAMFGKNSVGIAAANDPRSLATLESINERMLLSDAAKRIAYRDQDVQALRAAIQEELARRDFDSAQRLAEELATVYGYREESEIVRDQVNMAQAQEVETKVAAAIARLDELLQQRDFEAAQLEAAKIGRLFPESSRARNLNDRVAQARGQYKLDLEREFLRAAETEELERAMQMLREMDKYLTPQEAAPLQEVARGVIGKSRDNLGVRFKLALQDKDWTRAVVAGEQIIGEFPNSKMADEVRSMIDTLRRHAAGQIAATPYVDPSAS